MHIVVMSAIIINIILILVLLVGLFYNFEQPKIKAIYGYSIAGSMILYMLALIIVGIFAQLMNYKMQGLVLFLCVLSPFVIGKLVKHKTLKKYTVIQILCFLISLITLLLKF